MSLSDDDILGTMFRCVTLGQTMAQAAFSLGSTRSGVAGIIKRMRDAAPRVEAARLRDSQVLTILDRHFLGRVSAEVIAKDFARVAGPGFSRMAVLYVIWWAMNDLHVAGADLAVDPDCLDVTPWPHWWRPGPTCEAAA